MNLRHPQESDPDGVTVWERKAPEEDPAIDVRLADGLRMPSADKLTNEVDLEDWIREGERQIAEYEESWRVLLVPIAVSLVSGGIVGAITTSAAWIAVVAGALLFVYQIAETFVRRHTLRARWRRVDAYRRQLRDLRIPPNTDPAVSAHARLHESPFGSRDADTVRP